MEAKISLTVALAAIIFSVRKMALKGEFNTLAALWRKEKENIRLIKKYMGNRFSKKYLLLNQEFEKSLSKAPEIVKNDTGVIVFDVETTGLSFETDEILQISIIDGNGNTLINEYVKPYHIKQWNEAQKINGITPEKVKDAKYPHELIPLVRGIFNSATTWIAYNDTFDLGMLHSWGIEPDETITRVDVMKIFAKLNGEWNERFKTFRWKKLIECAKYYNFQFDAHDSLEDVKATLFCYRQMEGLNLTGANITAQRLLKGLSREEVSELLPMNEAEYIQYEESLMNPPTDRLKDIAAFYNVDIEELVEIV